MRKELDLLAGEKEKAGTKTDLLLWFFFPFGNTLLTEGIFTNNWFRSGAGLTKANIVLCDDTELILGVRNKAGDCVHGGGDLGFVVSHPLVSGCLLAFNIVACDSRATVIFRPRPGQANGTFGHIKYFRRIAWWFWWIC